MLSLCASCGEPVDGKWCAECVARHERRRGARVHQQSKDERARMRRVVQAAERDSGVVCWLCLSRVAPPFYDGKWTADHVKAGVAGSDLMAAHRGCNSARGARSPAAFRRGLVKRAPDWF